MVIRNELLNYRIELLVSGSITYSGVGDKKSVCIHIAHSVRLPLLDGYEASLIRLCLDKIMTNLPKYLLMKLAQDIRVMCRDKGVGDLWKSLPKLP